MPLKYSAAIWLFVQKFFQANKRKWKCGITDSLYGESTHDQ